MKSYCETQEEYKISQNLIYRRLSLNNFTKYCGKHFIRCECSFIRKCITSHEENFLFCNRKKLKHFNKSSNESLEGNKNGIIRYLFFVPPLIRLQKFMSDFSKTGETK